MAAKKRSGPLRRVELDPEPPVKVGALRRPLGFPAANRSPQRDVRTGRLPQAPGRSMLVQKIVAPTRALQANSVFYFSKSAGSNEAELLSGFQRQNRVTQKSGCSRLLGGRSIS